MQIAFDYTVQIALGLLTTVVGILLLYWLAKPSVRLGKRVSYSIEPDGSRRFRLFLDSAKRLPAINVRVYARLVIRGKRTTSVRVPLTNDEYPLLRSGTNRVPRLLLQEIDWHRYISGTVKKPGDPLDLESVMNELGADLVVDLVASSGIFNVTAIRQARYTVGEIQESPLSLRARATE